MKESQRESASDVAALRQRLAEAEAINRALIAGQVDAVANAAGAPILLQAAQEALARSERQLRAVFEGALDAMLLADDDGRYVDANPAACTMLGCPRGEILGRSIFDFSELSPAEWQSAWRNFLERGHAAGDHVIVRRDGTRRQVEFRASANIVPGRHLSVLRDVTDSRSATEMLQAIVQAAPVAIRTIDLDGCVLSWNPAAERMFGWSADEVVGRTLPIVPKDETAEALAGVRAGASCAGVLTRRVTKEGRLVEVLMSQAPLRDGSGRVVGALGIFSDLSEQQRLQEQLFHAQKMEAVGRLAGGIAHDFNNMLAAIQGFAVVLREELPVHDPGRESVGEILKAVERAASLTRQLLAFSRRQVVRPEVLDVNHQIAELERMLRRLIGEDIELRTHLTARNPRIKADAGQLEQVLMNLAINARDAMPRGGALVIETGNVHLDEAGARNVVGASPGDYVLIVVSDTGVGMDPETQARIFEPFFTTKDKGRGTGLGLSTVYGIVSSASGHIEVNSSPGQGARFLLYWPCTREADPPRARGPQPGARLRGTETVLVVEDEDLVRRLATRVLAGAGYKVIEAVDGPDALRICEAHRGAIHLMLTDVVMPRMSGRELVEHLRALRPEIRVLYMSGYATEVMTNGNPLGGDVRMIEKPFSPEVLLAEVRRRLDAG